MVRAEKTGMPCQSLGIISTCEKILTLKGIGKPVSTGRIDRCLGRIVSSLPVCVLDVVSLEAKNRQ